MPIPQPSFDALARPYRWLEYLTLGPFLTLTRNYFLPALQNSRQALLLGDGDGRFLVRLLRQNSHLRADAVDTSPAMLRQLRRRCGPDIRLRTHHHSALDHAPSHKTDLIVAHFFFDCLLQPDLDRLIHRLARQVRPDTLWLVSDFRIPSGLLRQPTRLFLRALYLAFRLLTGLRTTRLPDHAVPLTAAGLVRTAHHRFLFGILFTELWQKPSAAVQSLPCLAASPSPSSPAPPSPLSLKASPPMPLPGPPASPPTLSTPN